MTIHFPQIGEEGNKWLAKKCFENIVKHFESREVNEKALSIIAAGASFEQWMSFESRLALENSREQLVNNELKLNMTEKINSKIVTEIPRYWIENEYGKVDLLIGQCLGYTENGDEDKYVWDDGKIAFEFKVIHNNKNWRGKVESIWIDLCDPPRGKLTKYLPTESRFAIVAVVFKTYPQWITSEGGYPGQISEERKVNWIGDMEQYLTACDNNKKLNILENSDPTEIDDPFLIGKSNTITFYLLNSEKC